MNLRVVISFYLLDALARVVFVAIDTLIFFFVLLLDIQFSLIVWWDTCSLLCASIFSILFCDLSVLHPNNQCKTKRIFLLWVYNPHCNRLLLLFALLSLLFFLLKYTYIIHKMQRFCFSLPFVEPLCFSVNAHKAD